MPILGKQLESNAHAQPAEPESSNSTGSGLKYESGIEGPKPLEPESLDEDAWNYALTFPIESEQGDRGEAIIIDGGSTRRTALFRGCWERGRKDLEPCLDTLSQNEAMRSL